MAAAHRDVISYQIESSTFRSSRRAACRQRRRWCLLPRSRWGALSWKLPRAKVESSDERNIFAEFRKLSFFPGASGMLSWPGWRPRTPDLRVKIRKVSGSLDEGVLLVHNCSQLGETFPLTRDGVRPSCRNDILNGNSKRILRHIRTRIVPINIYLMSGSLKSLRLKCRSRYYITGIT